MVAARTVLYIEDNPIDALLVERVLARRPTAELAVATSARDGFELAGRLCPDLILLDLHLGDLSGEELLLRLQADPRTRSIPVVLVSADAMVETVARLRAAGAARFLTKPFALAELLALVDAVPAPVGCDSTLTEAGEAPRHRSPQRAGVRSCTVDEGGGLDASAA